MRGAHKAMSWDYACKLEEQLKQEVATLLAKAENDSGQGEREIDIPQEMQLGQARLEKIGQIKGEIEQRAQARYKQEKAEYDSKLAERAAKEKARGRKLGGRPPQAPQSGPQSKDSREFHRFRVADHAGFWGRF